MVRLASLALALLAAALTAEACSSCQCLFADASHCCVVDSNDGDCTRVCAGAQRGSDDAPCSAEGKYVCISEFTKLGRMSCSGSTSQ